MVDGGECMSKALEQIKNLNVKRIETISVDMTKFGAIAVELVEQAERAEIKDSVDYAMGGDLIKIASVQSKKVDEMRKELSGPFHVMWKFINTQFNTTKDQFGDVRKAIEPKMLAWKKIEDEKLRKEAAEEAKKLEEEALERAALEQSDEGQDEVLEAAAEASEELVEKAGVKLQRGDYGSSTGTAKKYSTYVTSQLDFLRALIKHIDDGNARNIELGSIIALHKGALNALAKDMRKAGVKQMPGAVFTEEDSLRVY